MMDKKYQILLWTVLLSLLTAFSLTAQEFRRGCVLDEALYQKVPLVPSQVRGSYQLESKVSLRKYAPTPQNQGSYGTCVGWSVSYAARTIMMAHQKNWENPTLINENAFSPYFIYEQAKSVRDIYCQEGTSLYSGLEIIKGIGTVGLYEFEGQCGQMITPQLEQKASRYKIKEYRRLFDSDEPDKLLKVKRSISEARPVVIGIQCCAESFLTAKGVDYWALQPNDNPNPDGGHALTVIGYDDNKEGGAVELMNSWGTTWGDGGFIWMSYKEFEQYCFEAYEMEIEKVEKEILVGKLQFNLTSDKEMKAYYKENQQLRYYQMENSYHSGTQFRLYIENASPAYVYAFGTDLSGATYKVFPNSPEVSPLLNYNKNKVAIPNENQYLQLDQTIGIDYFCVLYSKKEIDLDKILTDFELATGSILEKLELALKVHLNQSSTRIQYFQGGEIGFNGILNEDNLVPLIVAIPHIK